MNKLQKIALLTIGLFLIGIPVITLAGSNNFEDTIYVAEDEIIEGNFIKAASIIEINGPVNGDVIAAGTSIIINGPVAGDVIVAGATVRITGSVGGSVRAVGSLVEVSGAVEHNVWIAGDSVLISEEATVGWDVYAAGATADVRSVVGGNVWLAGASVILDGTVGKDVKLMVGNDGQAVLNSNAKVSGNLDYSASIEDQLVLREGAEVLGETSMSEVEMHAEFDFDEAFGAAAVFFKVITLFSLLVVGLILVTLLPKLTVRIYDEMIKRPWPSIGWGVVYIIITPIIAVLLMITVIGIPLGLILVPLYFIGIYIAKVSAGFAIGLLILNKIGKDGKYKGSLIWPLVLGLAIFVVLSSIPVIGPIVKIIAVLWALGAALTIKKEIWREYR